MDYCNGACYTLPVNGKKLALTLFAASLLAIPGWAADNSGSFFARARKSKTAAETAPAVPAKPATISEETLRKRMEEKSVTEGLTLTEIEKEGIVRPPKVPGIGTIDMSRRIPKVPTAPKAARKVPQPRIERG
jgi:hypothetical protein